VLAYDERGSLWDAARLLSVGEEGYAYRARVGARVRTLPEFKEIAEFFTAELSAQLTDSRSTTTSKLDAPVNKLARLLNSASIKRVLLNESLTVDFDRVIEKSEVLVVKGALGRMGAGNTSVLMQLLVGMLDAAMARRQDNTSESERTAVALKVDEAPLVLNRGFAETLALKRSAGLETVACWQTDAQWTDREVRDQLDALFAHRVYFATASVRDARAAASLMMAEYSDTVRPDIAGLSALGRPDVRLHLPKHHAIVSWVTPEGRQPPFIAQTIPLKTDPGRLAAHAAKQAARGARYLADLSRPHWERDRGRLAGDRDRERAPDGNRAGAWKGADAERPDDGRDGQESFEIVRARSGGDDAHGRGASMPRDGRGAGDRGVATPAPAPASAPTPPPLPEKAAESYAELVDLDGAHRVKWASTPADPKAFDPDPLDLEVLALVASMRSVLTSQIHRRFNPGRAVTTTQRRLKRLSDAAAVGRFQMHRRDGAGAPMCYVIAERGAELLRASGRRGESGERVPEPHSSSAGEALLREARRDVHATGWALALERALGGGAVLKGREESALAPPLRSTPEGRTAIGPADLRLPGGRTPHDFLRTDAAGARVEVQRFETVRPDATVEVAAAGGAGAGMCLLIELDDRLAGRSHNGGAAKLERYDHLLAGWSLCLPLFTRRRAPKPVVVFVCRDRARARECARRADHLLTACRAYAGEHPWDWEYPGREAIVFAAERDIHEGVAFACGVPRLPPNVRAAADGPSAREATIDAREIVEGLGRR
jgi:Replication-relaxation